MSNERTYSCLGYIGDEIPTPFFLGDFNSRNPGWLGYIGDCIPMSYGDDD